MEEALRRHRSLGMDLKRVSTAGVALFLWGGVACQGGQVATVDALVAAVSGATEGEVIEIAAGSYELTAPLDLGPGITLKGAGIGRTILTAAAAWKPPVATLPDPEMKTEGLDTAAYLIRLRDRAEKISVSHLSLHAPQLHGAIFGTGNSDLHLHHLRIEDFLWSGIRTFSMQRARVHDCEFIDAGGRWEKGAPGVKGGITGGGIFAIWMADSEIAHNRFTRTQRGAADEYYGIKVRQAKRCRIHHNTIETNFSMEFPFENDEDVEISHNICHGTISIPKHAGGPVPASGRTFHIHHNWMKDSYSIEFVRNGVEISHNLFDFDPEKDHGNAISGFGQAPAAGPAVFHNNLVNHPGRGVIWINEPYAHLTVRNNHIIARRTATPRTDGLFGFSPDCDFKTFRFENNIIECHGPERPLFRNDESGGSHLANNRLTGISDTARYANPRTDAVAGLEQPLVFHCGVHGEVRVDGWEAKPAHQASPPRPGTSD